MKIYDAKDFFGYSKKQGYSIKEITDQIETDKGKSAFISKAINTFNVNESTLEDIILGIKCYGDEVVIETCVNVYSLRLNENMVGFEEFSDEIKLIKDYEENSINDALDLVKKIKGEIKNNEDYACTIIALKEHQLKRKLFKKYIEKGEYEIAFIFAAFAYLFDTAELMKVKIDSDKNLIGDLGVYKKAIKELEENGEFDMALRFSKEANLTDKIELYKTIVDILN